MARFPDAEKRIHDHVQKANTMSDKHTDALQAYALEEKKYGTSYMAEYVKEMEPDADGEWFKRADVEALFRATEGQAQTSAAVECGTCHGSGWVSRDADIGTEQECFSCGGSGEDQDAAQLTDKTAPGAAEGDVLLAGIQAVCVGASQEYTRCKGKMRAWDSGFFAGQLHVFDMYTTADKTAISEARGYLEQLDAAQLADSTAPGALPVGWRDKLRWSKANTDYHGLVAFTPDQLEHFVSMLAAPTAQHSQQSLTAGGAEISGLTLAVIGRNHFGNPIPKEWYAAAKELIAAKPSLFIQKGFALMPLEPSADLNIGFAYVDAAREAEPNMRWSFSYAGYRAALKAGETLAAREIAAAPLPQVQSEALEAVRPQPNHPGRWLRGNDGISYPSKQAAQQPVTPSGALADNDGGVK